MAKRWTQQQQQQQQQQRRRLRPNHRTSCPKRFWKISRHCCCTSGWYPVLVAPFVTVACVLSLYSSSGCDFIDLSIGFVPSNAVYNNHSQANLGFFFHYDHYDEQPTTTTTTVELATANDSTTTTTGNSSHNTKNNPSTKYQLQELFHDGCVWYGDTFEETVISRDRTWRVGRIISMIAGAASLMSFLTTWLIILLPTPIGCVWPVVLLPATLLSFIAEGSKFLLFDVAICRNAMWYPSGVDSLPEVAESCGLGSSAYYAIAAAVLHFMALLCVCLNAPEKRQLDPDFGIFPLFDCDDESLDPNSTEPADFAADTVDGPNTFYSSDPSPSSTRIEGMNASIGSLTPDTTHSEPGGYTATTRRTPVASAQTTTSYHSPKAQKRDDGPPHSSTGHVSESRLAVISKMSFGTPNSEEIIAQLCSELDHSLAATSMSQNGN